VQGTLEQALAAITGENVHITGSGRTDAGAHAIGQVFAFDTGSSLPADTFRRALNAHLPRDISVTASADAPEAFHPRFDATARVYRYLIWNRPERSPFWRGRAHHIPVPLDVDAMSAALGRLVGLRDMSSFVPVKTEGSRARHIFSAECRRDGDLISVTLEASGFMRQMVRAIVGTVIRVGRGTMGVGEFATVAASGSRLLAGDTAPAEGLYLVEVIYGARSRTEGPCRIPEDEKENA
jgi:tRNA pseudouridine38-40 synthase